MKKPDELVPVDALMFNSADAHLHPAEVQVAVEAPVNIHVNGKQVATLFVTPSMIKELAIGNLLGEGILRSLDEIKDLTVRNSNVYVKTKNNIDMRIQAAKTVKIVETACGSTEDFYRLLDRIEKPTVKSNYKIRMEDIRTMARELNSRATLFKKGGAVHSCALYEKGKLVISAEDVGRHNATDKVIGAGALMDVDFSQSVLIGTGRQPAGMVMKIARVGIPISISVRGPIHSGIHVARKTGVTLVCFGREPGITIYSNPERILIGGAPQIAKLT